MKGTKYYLRFLDCWIYQLCLPSEYSHENASWNAAFEGAGTCCGRPKEVFFYQAPKGDLLYKILLFVCRFLCVAGRLAKIP